MSLGQLWMVSPTKVLLQSHEFRGFWDVPTTKISPKTDFEHVQKPLCDGGGLIGRGIILQSFCNHPAIILPLSYHTHTTKHPLIVMQSSYHCPATVLPLSYHKTSLVLINYIFLGWPDSHAIVLPLSCHCLQFVLAFIIFSQDPMPSSPKPIPTHVWLQPWWSYTQKTKGIMKNQNWFFSLFLHRGFLYNAVWYGSRNYLKKKKNLFLKFRRLPR